MELAASPFPPMMLMTLVENAIKHGIDPLQEGGEISIIASRESNGAIAVTVADTGAGITNMSGTGVGLQNIRERLAALFDRAASLSLDENTPRGVIATIRVPQS
jgi:sensor histidine kinase YesM